jgi:tetratricopeptide (TPR) repeat protein/CHAT domain-containing protein
MIRARVELEGQCLYIQCINAKLEDRRDITSEDLDRFDQWIGSYRLILQSRSRDNRDALFKLGQDIYNWLNGAGGWLKRLFASSSSPPFILDFTVTAQPGKDELRFLEVPWELLADNQKHLGTAPTIRYCPVRRIGIKGEPWAPSTYRLNTVFMAAAPRGSASLRYEEEEVAILDAAGTLGMDLIVEESGNPDLLAECIAREKTVDVLHISCHGTVDTKDKNPVLLLETEEGTPCPTSADDLALKLGGNIPRLLFLSACMTSEPGSLLNSISAAMIKYGFPSVLGWSGSVGDEEATQFASALYRHLSQHQPLEDAMAWSRLELFINGTSTTGAGGSKDWHLARLYLGKNGGGILTEGSKARRRRKVQNFLNRKDKLIPVAGRTEFVGRRRQIQHIIREFNTSEPEYAGVLIHGIGRQGKSSLAARIANRLVDHKVVVIYEHYDALSVLEAILHFAYTPKLEKLISKRKKEVENDDSMLFGVLRQILEGPCREKPLLLVIDDFERALDDPLTGGLHQVKSHLVATISSVIDAFVSILGETLCKLIFTSRYQFTLPYKGRDLASELLQIHLPPMEEFESRKQAFAKEKNIRKPVKGIDPKQIERCIQAARGNPGLQDLLFTLCLEDPIECDKALTSMEEYIESGRVPNQGKLLLFIKDLALQRLVNLLSPGEKDLLRASTLFRVPVPVETLGIIANGLGIAFKERFGDRFFGFGLWVPFEDMVNSANTAVAACDLVRPRVDQLKETESIKIAGLVVQDLFNRWGGGKTHKRPYAADIELARLALEAQDTSVLESAAKDAVRGLEKKFQYKGAAQLAGKAIRALDNAGVTVSVHLLRAASEVSQIIGDIENARSYIDRALEILSPNKDIEPELYAYTLITYARMMARIDNIDKALSLFNEAKEILVSDRFLREHSIVSGEIARLRAKIGELQEALELHHEELEVYKKLGDHYSQAAAMGDIARIKVKLGEVDEALKLHQEQVSIFESLGEYRSLAVVRRDIASIRFHKGEVDEAIKLCQEQLMFFEEIKDPREIAITKGIIAHILVNKGEVDKAMELFMDQLMIYEEQGNLRAQAITKGDIARIRFKLGEVDKALELHQEELQVYEKLGDNNSRAAVLGDIARIRVKKEELENGLQLYFQQLSFFEKIGNRRSKALAYRDIARILVKTGWLDEALALLREQLIVFEGLGDLREEAVTKQDIARILLEKGDVDQALKLQQEKIETCQKIGDPESRAITLWDIGKIMLRIEDFQSAYNYFKESYDIFCKLKYLEMISRVGRDLGTLLYLEEQEEKGLKILEHSLEGFKKIGQEKRAAQVREIIDTVSSGVTLIRTLLFKDKLEYKEEIRNKIGGIFKMKRSNFKLGVEGEKAEETAKDLSDFLKNELGWEPVRELQEVHSTRNMERAVDPLALAAVILALPSAVLAALDIVERMKKKKDIDKLIQWAKNQPGKITIITPEGTAIQLQKADSGNILDAANKAVQITDSNG